LPYSNLFFSHDIFQAISQVLLILPVEQTRSRFTCIFAMFVQMAPEWPQHRRVPAFGEWNYPRDGASDDEWPLTPCFEAFVRIATPPPAPKPNNMVLV
jgi:hypothetical protein